MNESPTRTLDDEEEETNQTASLEPAPLLKRTIAFAMDFILIILISSINGSFPAQFLGQAYTG